MAPQEAESYGAVEVPEVPVTLSADQAAPARSNRNVKLLCGLLVSGVAAVAATKVYHSGYEAATPVLAAQAPASKKGGVSSTESSSTESVESLMSTQREALRSSLIQVGNEDKIIFGHENSNREGQHFWDNAGMDAHSDVFNTTGQFPGMYGFSFQDIIDGSKLTNHVLNAARQNAVIEFFWEANNPVNNGSARDDTGYPCKALLPGGSSNDVWNSWMDIIIEAMYEFKIGDTHIPIILRLFHECTESWYWWGDTKCDAVNYKRAWNYTRWYLTEKGGLSNMLLVYAPAKVSETTWQAYDNWYPGTDQVDIIGFDRYGKASVFADYLKADCEIACDFALQEGKPCALAETGIADGIQEIHNTEWFMTDVLDNLFNSSSSSSCNSLSYMLTWSNEQPYRYWVPLPHQKTAHGFIEFVEDTRTIMAGDVRWSDITKEYGYGFKSPGKLDDIHGSDDENPRPVGVADPVNGVNGKPVEEDYSWKDWGEFEWSEERLSALPDEERAKVLQRIR